MAKTVQPIAIELGIKGGEKLAALNRSFRDLSKQIKLSDVDIIQATKDVAKFAEKAGDSEATIKGQIKAFEGLREQAAMGGKAYVQLGQKVADLKASLNELGREAQEQAKRWDTLFQAQKAAASALGLGGREDISSLYQGIIGLSTADIRRQQQMMGKSATEVFNDIATAFSKGGQAVDLKAKSTDIGDSIAEGIVDGASDSNEINSGAKTFAQRLIAAYKSVFSISSPSKETEQKIGIPLGLGIIRGLIKGLREGKREVQQEIESIAEPVIGRSRQPRRLIGTVNQPIATFTGYGTVARPAQPGYRPLGQAAAEINRETDQMFDRFRAGIAALTTDAEIYYNLLKRLPASRITTDLADLASKRARAAEVGGFIENQRLIGPGELEREIASSVAGYLKDLRTPNPWVGITGDYKQFINSISAETKRLRSSIPALPPGKVAGLLPPAPTGLTPAQQRRVAQAYARSDERSARISAEDALRGRALPPGQAGGELALTSQFIGGGSGGGGRTGRAGGADRSFARLNRVLSDFGRLSDRSTADIRELGASLSSLGDILSPLDADFEKVNKAIDKQSRLIDEELQKRDRRRRRGRGLSAGQLAQAAGATISGGIFGGPEGFLGGAIGTALGGPGGAFAGAAIGAQVGGLRQQLGGFADYAAQISKLEIALKGVAGSVEQYDQALKAARRSVEELNVPQDVAIQGMTRLVAAVKGAGGGVNDAEIAFQNINSAIIATGGGAEEVSGAITALVQIFSKGKVSAEEINQIAERLPGTFNKIAAASGRTGPELTKALEQGQVGLNDLMKFLVQLGDDYGSVARDIANSSVSAGDRLNRAFDDMRRGVGDALQPIGAEFQNTFARFAEEIAPKVIEAAKNIANALKPVIENLDLLLVLVSSLAAGAAIGAVIKGILALKVAIIAVTGAFLGAKTAIAGLTAVMALSPIFAGALAVGGIVTGIYAITKALKGQREELQKLAAVNSGQFINNLSASERATKISATKSLLAEQGRIIREENEKLGQTEDKRAKRAIVERLSAAKKEEDRLSRNLKRLTAPVTEKDLKVSQFDDLISKDDKTGKAAEKEANRIAALQRAIAEFESRRKLLDIEAKITEARQAQVLAQSRGDVPLSDFIDDKLVALELEKAAAEESARYEAKEREIRETMSGQVADLSNQLNIMESIRAKQEAEARASAQTLDNEIRKTVELEAQNRLIAQSLVDRKFELGFITKSEYNQFLLNRERERINKEFSRAAPEERDQLLDLYRQQIDPTFAEGLAQNIRKIKTELEELINPINQVTSAANAIGTAFTDSFTSVINGSATTQEALANFFQSLSSYFLDMAAQIIQKMITMAILNQVVGLLPGLGSSASGFNLGGFGNLASDAGSGISGFLAGAAGILGNAKGNAFDGGLVTKPTMFAYANGGVGRFGLMGEAGPEAIMPLQRDSSGRLGVQASGGGGTVINITNNISDTQSNSKVNGSRDGKAAADQLSKLMVAVIQKEQRPGGVLNRR